MKNKKLIVLNSVVLGLSFLATLFMFVLPIDPEIEVSVFDFARLMAAEAGEGLVFAIPIFLTCVFGAITVAFSILGLLNSLGIIKKAKGYYVTNVVLSSIGTFFMAAITGMYAAQGYFLIVLFVIVLMFIANIVLSSIILSTYKKALKAVATPMEQPAVVEVPAQEVAQEPVVEEPVGEKVEE